MKYRIIRPTAAILKLTIIYVVGKNLDIEAIQTSGEVVVRGGFHYDNEK